MILPIALKIGTIGLILGATYISGCVRGSEMANDRIQRITEDYATFRINTEIVGKAAQKETEAIKATNEARKAASDESYSKALSVLGADLERLRKPRSYPDPLPTPAPTAVCGEHLRCFDRGEYDSAFARYWESEAESERATNGLIAEGAALKLKMDETFTWATSK